MSKKDKKKKNKKRTKNINKIKRSFGTFKKKSKKIRRKIKRSIKRSLKKTIKKIKSKILINVRMKQKYAIVDVPLDKETNKGTKASSDFVDYDYQHLNNIIRFIHSEMKQRNDIFYFKPLEDSFIEVNIVTKKIEPNFIPLNEYIENIKKSLSKRYVPITINIQLPTHSHANTILIDNESKNIEYFEPHGYKKEESTLESIPNAYYTKFKVIQLFFLKILPDYNFMNASDYFKRQGFQMKHDARHGYCVTWSVLYIHYRLLNPNISIDILIKYLYYHITLNKLLRYARYIEKILKL
jgi:hypothetical protein